MNAIALLEEQHAEALELMDQLKDSKPGAARQRALKKLDAALVAHMAIEEEILYPAMATASGEGEPIAEAFEEHLIARVALKRCADTVEDKELFGVRVGVLKELIEHHVKEEREELFPAARKFLGRERLDELGEEMEARFAVAKKESPAKSLDRAEQKRATAALNVEPVNAEE
jgi:hemerythrin-like domain-containing protein